MMMTIEEYRAAIYQILVDAKNEDGTPVLSEKEAREALNGFTDDELQDGILWISHPINSYSSQHRAEKMPFSSHNKILATVFFAQFNYYL